MARIIILTTTLLWVGAISYSSGSNPENDLAPVPIPHGIPSRPHGIKYEHVGMQLISDPLLLEVFLDVACKNAKEAFLLYLDLAHRLREIQLMFYLFPLPYHRAAMHGSRTLRIVREEGRSNDSKSGRQVCFLRHVFDNQDLILDRNLVNKTETELIGIFANFAEHCGVQRDVFYEHWGQKHGNEEAISEWKYGCSRGVSGTPYVFLNGVFLTNDHAWTFDRYIDIIQPLGVRNDYIL